GPALRADPPHGSRARAADLVLHLHRLEDQDERSGLHPLALGGLDLDDAARHEGTDLLFRRLPRPILPGVRDPVAQGVREADLPARGSGDDLDLSAGNGPREAHAAAELTAIGEQEREPAVRQPRNLGALRPLAAIDEPALRAVELEEQLLRSVGPAVDEAKAAHRLVSPEGPRAA